MKTPFVALCVLILLVTSAAAQDRSGTATHESRTPAEARQCVVSGKSWRDCLGLPPSYTITAFSTYESRVDFSKHPLAKPEGFKFRAPWSRSAVDFLMDPNFSGTGRLSGTR